MGLTEQVFLICLTLAILWMQIGLCLRIVENKGSVKEDSGARSERAFHIGALLFLAGIQFLAMRSFLGIRSKSSIVDALIAIGIGLISISIAVNVARLFIKRPRK